MHRQTLQSLADLILIPAMLMLAAAPGLTAQVVTNGGFESSGTGDITATGTRGWVVVVAGGIAPPPVFEVVGDTVEEGNRALKVTVHGLGTNQWDIQVVADSLRVTPGATYNYSLWAKAGRAGATVNLTIGNYAYAEYGALRPVTLSAAWQKFTMQFTVADTSRFIRGPIHFYGTADTGNSIYIDNLQIVDVNAARKPVIVEAEGGDRGSNFPARQDGDVTYVGVSTAPPGAGNPGDTTRLITYRVVFPDSGAYNLFARVRVDSTSGSFFYGDGFGMKTAALDADWIAVDGLATAGFSAPDAVVDGPGALGTGVWKWVNLTRNAYQGARGSPFTVTAGSLARTLQIGGGKRGLAIDKLAFGKAGLFFTVGALENDRAGVADTGAIYKGPPLAAGQSRFLGCAYDMPDNAFAHYWTQLTVANAGKFGSVAGSTDTTQWHWGGADAAYAYAGSNHLPFKYHNLIWGQQQPGWISGLDSAQQAAYIETWIRLVGQRYAGADLVDVVNEPLDGHNPPDGGGSPPRANYERALGGKGATGWDWVITAFTLARKYLPGAGLLINDFGIVNDNAATTSYLQIITLLKQRGLIDGIGVQGHRFELESADTNTIKSNLDRLAATGLPVYISELDLGNLGNAGIANDNQQLQLYQKIFPVLWRHPGVRGITVWGYVEDQMWQSTCFLLRLDGTARPALLWMAQYVKDNPVSVTARDARVPAGFALEQNFPNPFNPATTISYDLPKTSYVKIVIYDVLGRAVATLADGVRAANRYTITWNAPAAASGVYFCRMNAHGADNAGDFHAVKKLLLLR